MGETHGIARDDKGEAGEGPWLSESQSGEKCGCGRRGKASRTERHAATTSDGNNSKSRNESVVRLGITEERRPLKNLKLALSLLALS